MSTIAEEQPEVSAALAIPEKADASAIAVLFQPHGLDALLGRIRAEVEAHDADISTEKGRRAIASLAHKVARSKSTLDDLGKDLVAGLKAQTSAVDAERRRMRDELDDLKESCRRPLTEWENAEKARIQAHEDALTALTEIGLHCSGLSTASIAAQVILVESRGQRDWQEFAKRAGDVSKNVVSLLEGAREDAERREKAFAEAERLRREEAAGEQAERDDRIRQQAADQARRAAEEKAFRDAREEAARVEREQRRAERERKDAEEALLREKRQAEQAQKAAERQAEAARTTAARAQQEAALAVDRERARVAEETRRQLAAEAKREANRKHQKVTHNEIADAFEAKGCERHQAVALVMAMVKGEIPHIQILY